MRRTNGRFVIQRGNVHSKANAYGLILEGFLCKVLDFDEFVGCIVAYNLYIILIINVRKLNFKKIDHLACKEQILKKDTVLLVTPRMLGKMDGLLLSWHSLVFKLFPGIHLI
jgi:hypothetical protein